MELSALVCLKDRHPEDVEDPEDVCRAFKQPNKTSVLKSFRAGKLPRWEASARQSSGAIIGDESNFTYNARKCDNVTTAMTSGRSVSNKASKHQLAPSADNKRLEE